MTIFNRIPGDVFFYYQGLPIEEPENSFLDWDLPFENNESSDEEEGLLNSNLGVWKTVLEKTYHILKPKLDDALKQSVSDRKYITVFKTSIAQYPQGALEDYLTAYYLKQIESGMLTEQQKKIKQLVDVFASKDSFETALTIKVNEEYCFRYNAHEIELKLEAKFFAGICPLSNTGLVERANHFYYLLLNRNIPMVIDLTNEHDLERIKKKGGKNYWTKPYEYVQSKSVFAKVKNSLNLTLIELGENNIIRINYPWPDGKGTDAEDLYTFIEVISTQFNAFNLFVHCLKGRGRTGTFGTCLALFQATKNATHPFWSDPGQTIVDLICAGRKWRPNYVQTKEQVTTICMFANIVIKNRPEK